jgi:hypothetical protein
MLGLRGRAFSASDRTETAHEGVVVALHEGPVLYMVTEDGALQPWSAGLVEEAEPGAGEVTVARADAAVHYMLIEDPERYCTLERTDGGQVSGMVADPTKFPSPAWAVALDRVMEDADSAMCDLACLTDDVTGTLCSNPVGWVLHEDDDNPARSGLSWRTVVLVHTSDGIAAVCEDDAPDTLYSTAAVAARQAREKYAREAARARLARGQQ